MCWVIIRVVIYDCVKLLFLIGIKCISFTFYMESDCSEHDNDQFVVRYLKTTVYHFAEAR